MGLTMIGGLPAHVLLVHLVVVLVPVAGALVVLSAAWPAARRRLGIATPVVAVVTVAVVPVTTDAGGWLLHRIPRNPLVIAHVRLGDRLLPWTIGLAAVAVVGWVLHRFGDRLVRRPMLVASAMSTVDDAPEEKTAPSPRRPGWVAAVSIALIVVAAITAGGSVYQLYRIGDSGAKAVWQDKFSPNPLPSPGGHG